MAVAFDQLVDRHGGLDLQYRDGAAALDGRWITIEGYLAVPHAGDQPLLLIDAAGACPDCSFPPAATVRLLGVTERAAGLVPGATRVTCEGRLSVGFDIDPDGHASFLRLADARVVGTGAAHRVD